MDDTVYKYCLFSSHQILMISSMALLYVASQNTRFCCWLKKRSLIVTAINEVSLSMPTDEWFIRITIPILRIVNWMLIGVRKYHD